MPEAPTRKRILASASTRLLAHGPGGLVLDAVASDAGVSKGGLLYHFPSKEALAGALIAEMVADFEAAWRRRADSDGEPAGRSARAYLHSTVDREGAPADASARLMAGLLAGVGAQPERLAELRTGFARWQGALEADGIDPVRATVVRLAADGLWLSALLGLPPLSPDLGARVVEALDGLSRS